MTTQRSFKHLDQVCLDEILQDDTLKNDSNGKSQIEETTALSEQRDTEVKLKKSKRSKLAKDS